MAYYLQTSLTGLVLLGIIYFNFHRQGGMRQLSHRLFGALLASNAALLLLELLLNLTEGMPGRLSAAALRAIVLLFYALNPVPSALWVVYVRNLVMRREHLSGRYLGLVALPVLAHAALALASIWGGQLFTVSAQNVYARGPLFPLMVLIDYAYLVVAVVLVFRHRSVIRRREFASLLLFPLLPLLGGTLQALSFGVSVLWLALSFSLLLVYLEIQHNQVLTDHLTGLANRRRLDGHLEFLRSGRRGRPIGGIMLDLDGFKEINDRHGHDVGDRVLESVAAILGRSLRNDDLVARFGGDEFVVILELDREEDLDRAVGRVRDELAQFNAHSPYPFELSFSIGAAVYDARSGEATGDFLKLLDDRMYESKRARRLTPA